MSEPRKPKETRREFLVRIMNDAQADADAIKEILAWFDRREEAILDE